MKIPVRMMLKVVKSELMARGAPAELLPRKMERGEDTILYCAQYLLKLLLAGAEIREWVADYADTDSGDVQINALRPGRAVAGALLAEFDEFDGQGPQPGADPVAVMAAGTGASAGGPRGVRSGHARGSTRRTRAPPPL